MGLNNASSLGLTISCQCYLQNYLRPLMKCKVGWALTARIVNVAKVLKIASSCEQGIGLELKLRQACSLSLKIWQYCVFKMVSLQTAEGSGSGFPHLITHKL